MTRQRREKHRAGVAPSSEVIAECIADAGYGTDSYDPETSECTRSEERRVGKECTG